MPYYVRVLSTASAALSTESIQSAVKSESLTAELEVSSSRFGGDWDQVVVSDADRPICCIDRVVGEVARELLEELASEIEGCEPASAALWLLSYLKKIKTIYSIQVLRGAHENNGWDLIEAIQIEICGFAPAITQADNEGYYNEDGFQVLWQFVEDQEGWWWVAVLRNEKWVTVRIDLGNSVHREAFLRGEVPPGVVPGKP